MAGRRRKAPTENPRGGLTAARRIAAKGERLLERYRRHAGARR